MVDEPKRKKRRAPRPRSKKKRRRDPDFLASARELDLRTLVVLSLGEWWELGDHEWPPEQICHWLEQADLRQLRGVLLATLERWHELRQRE